MRGRGEEETGFPGGPVVKNLPVIYMESSKMVLKNLFIGQQWRNRHREETYGHGERGKEGGMCGKSNTETYITVCKINSQKKFAVWLRKLKQGLCMEREMGGRFKREGIYVYLWPIHVEV